MYILGDIRHVDMSERVQECSGYDDALAVLMDYVEPVSAEPDWEM